MKRPLTRLILTLIASFTIFSSVFSQKEKDRVAGYIQQYKELAISEMMRTGVPAAITLAQGLLETGFGQSDLALNANNHFGIKCNSDWTGETVLHDDDTKGECFRKYSNVEDSYRDHSDFLKNRPRYASLFTIDPADYKGWAQGLKKAGYATNPAYAERLIKFIEENNLQDFTLMALSKTPAAVFSSLDGESEDAKEEIIDVRRPANLTTISKSVDINKANSYPKGAAFNINASRVIFVEAGTSLFAVAANNGITFNKLLDYNDLPKLDILEKGQLIFLEKKQRKGSKDFHVVEANEELYDIAQVEGVQLNSLLEFNHLSKTSKPLIGQKIYLKAAAPASTNMASNFSSNSRGSMD